MGYLSAAAYRAYRSLVYETDGLERFFRESTVIGEIANPNIGSRPSLRKPSERIEDLRAIPWVFSWAQCRLMLPGWYGFGTAVKEWLAGRPRNGMRLLQAMYREWPVLPDAAIQYGHGAGEERRRDCFALCRIGFRYWIA
jgi:phosphoenolpyruvate carboxylase